MGKEGNVYRRARGNLFPGVMVMFEILTRIWVTQVHAFVKTQEYTLRISILLCT